MISVKAIYPELSDLINRYRCVVDGNITVAINDNKKPILRKCMSFAKRGFYTELWYTYSDGTSRIIQYWN